MPRERQRDGERSHRGDQRTPEMRQQLVEDEQPVGAFERREVLRVVQVKRQSQTGDAETGESDHANGRPRVCLPADDGEGQR